MDLSNIAQSLEKIYKKSKEDSYIAKIIRAIPSGGDSSFTNKVGHDGLVLDYNFQNNTPAHLFARTMAICKYMQELSLINVDNDMILPIKVYRSVNLPVDYKDDIVQPVPFSTSWNMDFAVNWTVGSCCVYEITVPFDTFLPLSVPSTASEKLRQLGLNQSQEEVILPPCILSTRDEYVFETESKRVRVVRCDAVRLTPLEMVQYYPEKYRAELEKAVKSSDFKGWINERLIQYYDYEGNEEFETREEDEDEEIPEWD